MSLSAGHKLGPYEILSPIGAGGMGEIYKAKDTRLDRTVAIKILPSHVATHPQARQRFEREARAVSSLNHPHICTLYDIGSENGVDFMVMEHIEGQTLADRLNKGALPLDQALKYGSEIADALDKAHRQGVVHRDLKPGNIMLTKSGAKLLDFGLAKLTAAETGVGGLSALPTEAKPLTQEGSILGTFQYMAPEQLEGKEADARTDIFAFGAVAYEMLTGKRAFLGKSQASLIGAIMEQNPPPVSALQTTSPPALDHVIKTCLAKDPDNRWQSAADVMHELKWIAERGTETEAHARPPSRERLIWGGVVLALAGVAFWSTLGDSPSTLPSVSRSVIDIPSGQRLVDSFFSEGPPMALSPDGTRLVYSATSGQRPQLYLRKMDRFESEPIAGTEGGTSPFFSPDSQWLGFYAEGKFQKVPLAGGAPQTICDAPSFMGHGVHWGTDGTIVFGGAVGVGLLRVSANGGTPETLTTPDTERGEYSHAWPQILPDNKNVLFQVWGESLRAALLNLETREWHTIFPRARVWGAAYLLSGHIVYGDPGGTLSAVPFDLEQLRVVGSPVSILDGVHLISSGGRVSFAVSDSGSLVYEPTRKQLLAWVDRTGAVLSVTNTEAPYVHLPRISPNGERLLFGTTGGDHGRNLHVYDMERGTETLLTKGQSAGPMWTPDGKRITFSSRSSGSWTLSSKSADGSGEVDVLLSRPGSQIPASWSPDGRTLAYYDYGRDTGRDIWMLPVGGEPTPFLVSPFHEYVPRFSPDGRFVVYVSDESGQEEVYVQPYPGPGERTTISTGGGRSPRWSRDGRELFYRSGNRMMAVPVTTKDTFKAGKPKLLFSGDFASYVSANYDVSADGMRFLMVQEDEETARPRFHVVINWFDELKRLVPTN